MIQNSNFLTALQLQEQYKNSRTQQSGQENVTEAGLSFQDVLRTKTDENENLKFSKHASIRLQQRGISLTDSQMERLSDGTKQAGMKGIRDSLVIVDELAFIVNVPKNTVVTALDSTETDTNVFTNIDGAVIM
ncbi:MAG: flagellar protein [Lachnospiraceae bacterium]|nr:flagellar protein [Lachnospiraceae bacterium]